MSHGLNALLDAGSLPALSFYFAQFVARGSGEDRDSLLAQSAALVSQRNLEGDVCLDLAQYTQRPRFDQSDDAPRWPDLETWQRALRMSPWVGIPDAQAPQTAWAPLILDGRRLYLGSYWHFEQRVAEALRGRWATLDEPDLGHLRDGLGRLFDPAPHDGVDWQRVAAAIAVRHRFAVISGGPGTGKTSTVIKVLVLLLEQQPDLRIALAAPTGKAAARLSEAVRRGKRTVPATAELLARVPEEASTLHRLVGLGWNARPRHHRDNPLLLDCLVVDEASMIDLPLMARLLDALPDQARLVLLGDRDQLASVEAGSLLGDITGQGRPLGYSAAQVRYLTQVCPETQGALPSGDGPDVGDGLGLLQVSYRFGSDSGIGALARRVNEGQGETAWALLQDPRYPDIAWREARPEGPHPDCLDWAVHQYAQYLRQPTVSEALVAFERVRILAALHRGPFGVDDLNAQIEQRLKRQGLILGGDEYPGKPILVTSNDYEVGLFNGDIGLLWHDERQRLRAYFLLAEGQVRSLPVRQLPEHRTAYALTVHKSQGSEFDAVLLVLPHAANDLITRELIYTGITRAKTHLIVQGERTSFVTGCAGRVQRHSGLAARLGWPETESRLTTQP